MEKYGVLSCEPVMTSPKITAYVSMGLPNVNFFSMALSSYCFYKILALQLLSVSIPQSSFFLKNKETGEPESDAGARLRHRPSSFARSAHPNGSLFVS